MKEIENAAYVSIGRACGFSGLAIFCLMFGLSFEPVLAAKAGGVLSLMLAGILTGYGFYARRRPYKRTETWLILPKDKRPPPEIAQQVLGNVLRDSYLWFAQQVAYVALVFLGVALLLGLAGVERIF